MSKTLENFVKKINKLDNYYLLREEKDYLLIGTQIIIKEHKEMTGNIFQPYSTNKDKCIYVCFIIGLTEKASKLKESKIMPIIYISTKEQANKEEQIQELLNRFIQKAFD